MEKTPRIRIPPEVRQYVLKRDHHQCQSCGQTEEETELTIDHIIALAQGGSNDLSNLQPLCRRCNSCKQVRFDSRFQRKFNL
ncbi:HNH endonuclease [Phormidium tenue FACHB-886]|nr:HNH endonuclease [Phormidium tenue FACHB-886]